MNVGRIRNSIRLCVRVCVCVLFELDCWTALRMRACLCVCVCVCVFSRFQI